MIHAVVLDDIRRPVSLVRFPVIDIGSSRVLPSDAAICTFGHAGLRAVYPADARQILGARAKVRQNITQR